MRVARKIGIKTAMLYLKFLARLQKWLAGREREKETHLVGKSPL